jgi:hypothetical protein
MRALALHPGDIAIGHVRFYRNAAIHLAVIGYTEAGRWFPAVIRQPKSQVSVEGIRIPHGKARMYVSLLVLGVMVTLAGAAMLAFGIPINEFGLGNTLIIAGTAAFVGGLILIGVSEAVRQLRRIAESLLARPVGQMPRDNNLFEPASSGAPPAAPRIPFPPKSEPRHRAPAPAMSPEPRLDIVPALDARDDQLDRPPPAPVRSAPPPPRFVAERDETPLSPQAEPRFAAGRDDEKDELAEGLLATAFSRLDAELRNPPPAAEPAGQDDMFESLRPTDPGKDSDTDRDKDSDTEPAQPLAQEAAEYEQPTEEPRQEERPEEPYAVSILKSGVVDGMAYTLYSDGSIEAEMPEGTMRFVSITELRAYLEKSSS